LDPDPDPYWPPSGSTGSGSGSVKNEYGSETLKATSDLKDKDRDNKELKDMPALHRSLVILCLRNVNIYKE
jgi:hypothetical protein